MTGRVRIVPLLWGLQRIQFMNELQYRGSFVLQLVRTVLTLGTSVAVVSIVYGHIDDLGGWSMPRLLALVGVFTLVGGLLGTFVWPNLIELVGDVRAGTLEYLLLKPVDAQFLASVRAQYLWNGTDIVGGLGMIGWAVTMFDRPPHALDVVLFLVALALGVSIIYSFLLVLMTTVFWLVQVEEFAELFAAVFEAGRWPVSVYPHWLQAVLTLVVPISSALTVSTDALTARLSWWTVGAEALLALAFFVFARWFFKVGIRHYTGASA